MVISLSWRDSKQSKINIRANKTAEENNYYYKKLYIYESL